MKAKRIPPPTDSLRPLVRCLLRPEAGGKTRAYSERKEV